MERYRREIQSLKAKLGSALGLSWEAKEILRLYAKGLTDWQQGEYRKPWRVNYREALKDFGGEYTSPEGPSLKTLWMMQFMIQFHGGRDSERGSRSLTKFWLLARKIAPKQLEKLIVKDERDEEGKQFIKSLDEALADVFGHGEKAEMVEQEARVARRLFLGDMKIAMKSLRLHGRRREAQVAWLQQKKRKMRSPSNSARR